MNLTMLLDMVAEGMSDRVLIGDVATGLTGAELKQRALAGSGLILSQDTDTVIFLGGNGPVFPVALFAASIAGRPFLPVNFRLSDEQLVEIVNRQENPLIITDNPDRTPGKRTITLDEFMQYTGTHEPPADLPWVDPEEIAVLLMTSGTTAAPKSAVLRHRH